MKSVAQPKSNPTKIKPEMETKIKPDIDAAAASASAVPKVKAQEPDLSKSGNPKSPLTLARKCRSQKRWIPKPIRLGRLRRKIQIGAQMKFRVYERTREFQKLTCLLLQKQI